MPIKFKSFTKTDYENFGGAESFEDGGDPIIANVKFDKGNDGSAILIASGSGISVMVMLDEKTGDHAEWYTTWAGLITAHIVDIESDKEAEELLVAIMPNRLVSHKLESIGFQKII